MFCLNPLRMSIVLWSCISLVASSPEIRADDLPQQVKVGDQKLTLNGAGVRTKTFLQLYVAGLYLQQPSRDAVAIAAADEPMALRIQITSGFVSQSNLVESLSEGFQKATAGQTANIQAEIDQFRACFVDEINKGDVFDLVYHPRLGVLVNKNGKSKGVVKGLEFKRALFNIWLCNQPADASLKQALLQGGQLK